MDSFKNSGLDSLLSEFLAADDLCRLASDAGTLLGCPLLVIDDTYHVSAHYLPLGFSDSLFCDAIRQGEITYEVGALINQSPALTDGKADFIDPGEGRCRRRFSPLISAGVRLGYLVCVDVDGKLSEIPPETFSLIEAILAKQLFVEASRQDKPFETAEDILMHLLEGGFTSAAYFKLQTANTYLAKLTPAAFALIGLSASRPGRTDLRDEITTRFPDSHPFLYKGSVFLFLKNDREASIFGSLAERFQLRVVISEPIDDMMKLPLLYKTAREALELLEEKSAVRRVEELRFPLLIKSLSERTDLIPQSLRNLARHDKEKGTQFCETLYHYLCLGHSLTRTGDILFTHRNTILYRIRKIEEDFGIPINDDSAHAELLIGVSLLLFSERGAEFFLTEQNFQKELN